MSNVLKNYEKIKSYGFQEKGIQYLKKFEFLKNRDIYMELFLYYKSIRDLKTAEKYLTKICTIDPDNLQYKLILSTISLANNNFLKGFELLEHRLTLFPEKYPKKVIPLWKGETNKYKRIVIFGEQGFGDCIMYARFIKKMKSIFDIVDLCVSEPLINIFKNSNLGIDNVFSNGNIYDYDCYCHICSLPNLLNIKNEIEISNLLPYLDNNNNNNNNNNNKIKIGICLHGRLDTDFEKSREIKIDDIQHILNNDKYEIHSLYIPEKNNKTYQKLVHDNKIIEHPEIFKDFNLTSELIKSMDMVISSDTAIVHLAGTLQKKTFLLLPKLTDWRWKIDGEKSYWYTKDFTIIRQKEQGEWAYPISILSKNI